jgi:hypothetical protein
MTTIAQYPELPEEEKKDSDQSEISAQQQPTVGVPQASASPQAKPNAPTNSGLAQNFNAFREANKSKLSALQNMVIQGTQDRVATTAGEFGKQLEQEVGGIDALQKDYNSSLFTTLNTDSDLSGIKDEYTVQPADANPGIGRLSSGDQYRVYKEAAERAANLNSKAGTTNALVQGGTNAANAAQDSLLLQSSSDYRKAAQDVAQKNAGVADTALNSARETLGTRAGSVNAANNNFQSAAKQALQRLRGELDTDLQARAEAAEAARMSNVGLTENKAMTDFWSGINSAVATPTDRHVSIKEANARKELASMDQNAMLQSLGFSPDQIQQVVEQYRRESTPGVTADAIIAQDPKRQAQIAALNSLITDPRAYNTSASGPTASNALSSLQSLQERIKAAIAEKIANAPTIDVKPSAPGAGGGSSNTPRILN